MSILVLQGCEEDVAEIEIYVVLDYDYEGICYASAAVERQGWPHFAQCGAVLATRVGEEFERLHARRVALLQVL